MVCTLRLIVSCEYYRQSRIVFTKLFFSGKDNAEPSLEYDDNIVTLKDADSEIIRMIVKLCYNKKLELCSKSLVFLVELYITAASLKIADIQVRQYKTIKSIEVLGVESDLKQRNHESESFLARVNKK